MMAFAYLFEIDHVMILEMPHFAVSENLEISSKSNSGKIGNFKDFEPLKMRRKSMDFVAFRMKKPSHDKILLHVPFGTFHETPRMI